MAERAPLAVHDFQTGGLDVALEFLKRTRNELRSIHRVLVWPDRVQIFDVNRDSFEVRAVGYGDADVIPILHAVHTVFDPATIHEPTDQPPKEFSAGKRYPWAQDRVM